MVFNLVIDSRRILLVRIFCHQNRISRHSRPIACTIHTATNFLALALVRDPVTQNLRLPDTACYTFYLRFFY